MIDKEWAAEAIKNIEEQFQKIDCKTEWASFYQRIRNESNNYEYTFEEAKKRENKSLNRYRDVNPYDHSRVVLVKGTSDQDKQRSDYINASLIQMPNAHRRYILAQGPLPHTTDHFWLMIWEQNCKAVVMLNRVIEKNQIKCHQYWPLGHLENKEMHFPDVNLKVENVTETQMDYYTTRIFKLTNLDTGISREVHHFHYTTWPDFGVPQSPLAFLHFLMVVRRSGALDENVGPPVVHCSAGIGRSGTFCLVDLCLLLMEGGEKEVNVRDVLMEMRKHRMGLIQTMDQLRFSYLAILEGAKRLLIRDPTLSELEIFRVEDAEEEDEDTPPPKPPPRGESLRHNINNLVPGDAPRPQILPELPPDMPLPHEPQNNSNQFSDEEPNRQRRKTSTDGSNEKSSSAF
ncbi:tyrosine-protein phosphatase non-receptor type 1-like isoform X2 [Neocloeon triangulifer]|uniref:tyrosine-protein phosphatase non-receptor type 1-like isoform X2 n=1 Tax=Neocloeon triangulifer TaxID=2078957 RepID=UPI00286EDE1B|nr:tyrosine-protein phosphatase non-receptor type 1-like isoform X2 [Neocloeon triangulifer]